MTNRKITGLIPPNAVTRIMALDDKIIDNQIKFLNDNLKAAARATEEYEWREELLAIPVKCRDCEHRTKVSPNIPMCYHPDIRDDPTTHYIPFASQEPDRPDWCPLCVKKSPTVTPE